jgi:hypothetical protein
MGMSPFDAVDGSSTGTWPSLGAIAVQNVHILIAVVGQWGDCLLGELTNPLNSVDLAGNFREHAGGRARADLRESV